MAKSKTTTGIMWVKQHMEKMIIGLLIAACVFPKKVSIMLIMISIVGMIIMKRIAKHDDENEEVVSMPEYLRSSTLLNEDKVETMEPMKKKKENQNPIHVDVYINTQHLNLPKQAALTCNNQKVMMDHRTMQGQVKISGCMNELDNTPLRVSTPDGTMEKVVVGVFKKNHNRLVLEGKNGYSDSHSAWAYQYVSDIANARRLDCVLWQTSSY